MPRPILCLTLVLCFGLCLAACSSSAPSPASPLLPTGSPVPPSRQASPPATANLTTPASPATEIPGAATLESPATQSPATEPPATQPPATEPPATPLVEPPAPAAAPEVPCVNDARFIRDVTIPDGTQFLPGQLLLKKWSVQNAGTCDWGANYRLVFLSGDALGAPSEVALYPARAGATATLEIPMVASQTPGAYTSRWQARDPAGNLFGAIVFIKITVIPMPTAPSP